MLVKQLAEKYNEFQNSFGQSKEENYQKIVEGLFVNTFHKNANNSCLVAQRDELLGQLLEVRNAVEGWKVSEKEIIPSQDNKKCTIRYVLETKKAGSFDVIAILKIASEGKIEGIDEVFYQIA